MRNVLITLNNSIRILAKYATSRQLVKDNLALKVLLYS
jgi:hypothetical protein